MNIDWERQPLREVTTKIGSGATPLGGESAYKADGVALIRSLNVYDDGFRTKDLAFLDDEQAARLNNVIVEPGDVLLNITGASVARCCVVPDDQLPARVNQHVSIVRPMKHLLLPKCLHYMLISRDYKNRLLAVGEDGGSTRQAITKAQIQEFEIELPPLSEQERIVAILDEAFKSISCAKVNAEKSLRKASAIFESSLDALFKRRGDGWVDATLEEVLAVQPQNGWSPPAANHSTSGTPVLTLSSVTGFRFKPDKIKFTSAITDSRRHYWVKNGDLLITRSNTPELVGHVAIAKEIGEATIYPDLIMRMNPMPDRMITEFLYYQLRTPALRKEITGRAQGANPTMKKISNGAVRTLPITVPPISKQWAIIGTLNAIAEETEHLAGLYKRKLVALDALKHSLLHRAFAGELTGGKTSELIEAVA
jgi:type I restriction enzyme S subunit